MNCYARPTKAVLRRPVEPGLAALVAVMDDAVWLPLLQRHVQRREDEVSRHLLADRPPDDAPAPDVEHDGQEDEAGPGGHVSYVGNPQLVRPVGHELAVDQVGCRALPLIAPRRHDEVAPSADAADGVDRISLATRLPLIFTPCSISSARTRGMP